MAQTSPAVCDWRGYVYRDGVLANSSHVVTSYTNDSQATTGTIYDTGYYILHVPGSDGDNITFKICGVYVNESDQTWNCSAPGYHTLNLNMNTTSDDSACTYSCGCRGGYCCSGGTEINGDGTGTCQSSACTAATTTTPAAAGAGAAAVVTTTTPVTTTAPAVTTTTPVVTTKPKPVTTIPPRVTTRPKPYVPLGIELSTMQIAGIIVGVVVILALVIFLFVRFQAVKMAT